MRSRQLRRKAFFWALLGALVGSGVGAYLFFGSSKIRNKIRRERQQPVRVDVVRPQRTGLTRYSEQPCAVHAFERVDLTSGVSGFLKEQKVDYGSKVKKGDLLAVIDVPLEEAQVQKELASLQFARSQVDLAKSRVDHAAADWEAAKANIPRAKAARKNAYHMKVYRKKQLDRVESLASKGGLIQELADEKTEQHAAAEAAEEASEQNLIVAGAQQGAAQAKFRQSLAELANARAQVKVVEADLKKARVLVDYAEIRAPFNGVITHRAFFPKSYIRSAREGGGQTPLLAVARTDLVRLVLQVPDRDVPYADEGDLAVVEIHSLPGWKFRAPDGGPPRISRTQGAEDPTTRTMRVEIALANPDGKLSPGMPGQVKITLYRNDKALTIPSGCLKNIVAKKGEPAKAGTGKAAHGQGESNRAWVYVVRNSKAVLVPIRIGADDGVKVEVLEGLAEQDLVVEVFTGALANGAPVQIGQTRDHAPPPAAGH